MTMASVTPAPPPTQHEPGSPSNWAPGRISNPIFCSATVSRPLLPIQILELETIENRVRKMIFNVFYTLTKSVRLELELKRRKLPTRSKFKFKIIQVFETIRSFCILKICEIIFATVQIIGNLHCVAVRSLRETQLESQEHSRVNCGLKMQFEDHDLLKRNIIQIEQWINA